MISQLQDEITWIIALGVATFYMLSKASAQTLLSILVMAAFAWVSYQYLLGRAHTIEKTQKDTLAFFDAETKQRKEIASDHAFLSKAPKKGLMYLKRNEVLVEIAKDLVIVRMFDKARYSDLLLYMNELQKTYMYILDGRYSPQMYVPIFLDLRESIQELLYSIVFVVPPRVKHVYGVKPYEILEKNIHRFVAITRTMLDVLQGFAKTPGLPETMPKASDLPFDSIKSRKLP